MMSSDVDDARYEGKVKVLAVFVLAAHAEHLSKLREALKTEYGGVQFFPIVEI